MESDFQAQTNPVPHQPEVSFPQPKEPQNKGSNAKVVIAIIGVILILVAGGWFILGNNSGEATPSPTPNNGLSTFPTPVATSTPEPSPTATSEPVDKSEIKIEVLNGTGVPGEAGFLQGELEDLGYEDITAGNADDQDNTETVATYSRELSAEAADEITEKLESLYDTVRTRRATISGDFDISITTGTRKQGGSSATSSPRATSSARATSTPTATPDDE